MTVTGDQLRIAYKNPVRLATTANHGLTGLSDIDGVTPAAGDRILAGAQSTGSQNGIYIAASGAWSRARDMNETNEDRVTAGLKVFVQEGDTYAKKTFVLVTTGIIILGTTSLSFEITNPLPVIQTWQVYVSKAGSDANSGFNINLPKLTLGSAITAASSLSPSSANHVEIRIEGGGTWTEYPALPAYVSINGPEAKLTGWFTSIGADCRIKLHSVIGTTVSVFPISTTGERWIEVDYIQSSTGAGLYINHVTAVVNVDIGYIASTGVGSPVVVLDGTVYGNIGQIYVGGATSAIAVGSAASANARLFVGRILGVAGSTGVLYGSAGTMDISVLYLGTPTSYSVGNIAGVLNMFVNEVTGSPGTVTGTANVVVAAQVGDVKGPASSINNAIPRFDLGTGKLLKGGAAGNNIILEDVGTLRPEQNDGGALGNNTYAWSDLILATGGIISFNAGNVYLQHSDHQLNWVGGSNGYRFGGGPVVPASNDNAALGTTALQWADLFLASGGVINFNSDVQITHSLNTLSFSGASSGYKFANGPVVPTTNDGSALGTTSLAWSDLYLAAGGLAVFGALNNRIFDEGYGTPSARLAIQGEDRISLYLANATHPTDKRFSIISKGATYIGWTIGGISGNDVGLYVNTGQMYVRAGEAGISTLQSSSAPAGLTNYGDFWVQRYGTSPFSYITPLFNRDDEGYGPILYQEGAMGSGNITPWFGTGVTMNLLDASSDLSKGSWTIDATHAALLSAAALSPRVQVDADRINWVTSGRGFYQTVTLAASTAYVLSFWARLGSSGGDLNIYAKGTLEGTVDVATEWKRYVVPFVTSSSGTNLLEFYNTSTGTMYFWGFQLEQRTDQIAGPYSRTVGLPYSGGFIGTVFSSEVLFRNQLWIGDVNTYLEHTLGTSPLVNFFSNNPINIGSALSGTNIDVSIQDNAATKWAVFNNANRRMGIFGSGVTPSAPAYVLQVQDSSVLGVLAGENTNTAATKVAIRAAFPGVSTIATSSYWLACYGSGGSWLGGLRGNADTGTVIFQGFAGAHSSQSPGSTLDGTTIDDGTTVWERGMILSTVGSLMSDEYEATEEPMAILTDTALDCKVIGVFTDARDELGKRAGSDPDLPVLTYSAVGHSRILVTDKNGEVDAGDLVTSSSIPGYGQKQDDDFIHSYTVCKVTEQVDWSSITETIEEGGIEYKKALVACFVYCG